MRSIATWSLAAAGVALALSGAQARVTGLQSFSLGQSARTGAICRADKDSADPAAQLPYARAWAVGCRGFESVAFGHVYYYKTATGGAPGSALPASWTAELAKAATCGSFSSVSIPGFTSAERATCKAAGTGVDYVVYAGFTADGLFAGQGFEPIAELVQQGMRVAAGLVAPAQGGQVEAAGATGAGADTLSRVAVGAQQQPSYLRERAHLENQGWLFDAAERDFGALVSDRSLSQQDRTMARLNWALNLSNGGHFAEADQQFRIAAEEADQLHNGEIDLVALNYRALDDLNRGRLAEARTRASIAVTMGGIGGNGAAAVTLAAGDGLQIDENMAAELNRDTNPNGFRMVALSPAQRRQIFLAQAYYIDGVALEAGGNIANARQSFARAAATLPGRGLNGSGGWLRISVALEVARLDLAQGQAQKAAADLSSLVAQLPARTPTPADASLYMGLGRAEAAANQPDQALRDYATGMQLFRQTRGTLGDSVDEAAPYFDLLLARMKSDPGKAAQYQAQFFDAAQAAVGQATARTVARLAARVGEGSGTAGGLARALEDTQREITIKQAQIDRSRAQPDYPAAQRAADDAELQALNADQQNLQQRLLAADPRYGQLVGSAATITDLQKALKPGEIYVKTLLLGGGGYVMAVAPGSIDIYPITLSRSQAEAAVRTLRPWDLPEFTQQRLLRPFDVVAAHNLYQTIFAPIGAKVAAARHLIYEPDGALVSLPAAVLVTDAASVTSYQQALAVFRTTGQGNLYQNVAWLGRSADISLSVSAAGFLQSRSMAQSAAQRTFIGFGAPSAAGANDPRMFSLLTNGASANDTVCSSARQAMVGGLADLANIQQTLREIGQQTGAGPQDIVTGADFTDAAVMQRKDLQNYRIVFFGTHGLLPDSNACLAEPALVTSLGAGSSDALLDASEILQLHLDADLVVLSACNTGGVGSSSPDRTGLTGSGEALGGLARDFIYAGSRNLVVSQWTVSTDSTQDLMRRMFERGVKSQGDSLRDAEVTLMNSPNFAHPYYWAAFSLVGDSSRIMPLQPGS